MRAVRATLALLVLALAGCGGGGGGSASPPYVPASTPTPTVAPTPTPSGAPAPAPSIGYLAVSGAGFSGTTRAGTSAVTLAAISEILIPRPTAPAFVPVSIRVDVGKGATQALLRHVNATAVLSNSAPASSPRVSLSAERAVNFERVRAKLSSLRRAPTANSVIVPAAAPASSRTFAVLTNSIGASGNAYAQVATTLQQTTAHAYVYVDSSLGLSSALVAAIANDFENAYLSDTVHFGTPDYPNNAPFGPLNGTGTPCDANGNKLAGATPIPVVIGDSDPHTAVVVVSQSNAGNGEGGYFDPNNYFVQSFANCNGALSNQTPMIVLVWPRNADPNFETQEDMVRVTAHEFQHLINFVNHCILAPVCTPGDDPFLNEGLSMLAQDFAVHQLYPNLMYDVDEGLSFAGQFLQKPQSFNVGSFTGIDGAGSAPIFNCNGCYGGAYLFQRYLYNRFGGDAYTRAMTAAPGTAKANLNAVTGEDYGPLLGDFSIALMSSQNSLPASAAFTFALNPSGQYVDQFGLPLALPGLGIAGTNAPGTSTTYPSCQGCVFYVGVPTNGNTATVMVTDVSAAASLAAGVAQH